MGGWLKPAAAVGLAALAAGCGGGGGGGDTVSSASLKPKLLPLSAAPGFTLERTLDWSDPVDLVGQGIFIPEAIAPSEGVKVVDDAGFRGAAGEVLRQGTGPEATEVHSGVVKLKDDAGARKLRDWMHRNDLQQPCFAECIFTPANITVPGVPDAKGVKQVGKPPPPPPGQELPPGVQAPVNYLAEFTVGPYLYFAWTQADKSAETPFLAGVRAYYQRVK